DKEGARPAAGASAAAGSVGQDGAGPGAADRAAGPEGASVDRAAGSEGASAESAAVADSAAKAPEAATTGTVTVRGTVVDLEGKPLAQAAVRVSEIESGREPASAREARARTDEQGRFELKEVPAGRVRFLVAAPRGGATEYGQALMTTELTGGPVVEVGPIRLAPRKVKAGEEVGDLGYVLRLGNDEVPKLDSFVVAAVRPDGPAAKAGLLPGDEIVAVNGVDVRGLQRYLYEQLVRVPAGEVVRLGLARGVTVELTTGPAVSGAN
ncbi:MAG TPA: PDZ domain-containing protein, partial [Nannocystis sp.]